MAGDSPAAADLRAWKVILGGLLAGGLALRLLGLRYGLPAVYNPDEVAIMSRALAFAKGDLNPHNFLYPSAYFYVLFAWEGLTAVLAVAARAVASLGAFQREFFLDPTRVYVAGRLLTALLGTATIAVVWALARRLSGTGAAIAAAQALALSPLHVRDSHYVKHDVPAALLVALAYLAGQEVWRRGDAAGGRRALVLAAAVTGGAFSTHYYTIFLALPLAWVAVRSARSRRDAIVNLVIAAAVSAAVFALLSPFLVTDPILALRDIQANRRIVDRSSGGRPWLRSDAHALPADAR